MTSSWIDYIDRTGSFRVSYPSDWEFADGNPDDVNEILVLIEDEEPVEQLGNVFLVFGGGLRQPDGGFDPLISITVESLPQDMTVDEYASADLQRTREKYATVEQSSQEQVRVGDYEGVLVRESFDLAEVGLPLDGRLWGVSLYLRDGLLGWLVNCGKAGPSASDVTAELDMCETVARSFRP